MQGWAQNSSGLTDAEKQALSDSLFLQNRTLNDLSFDRHVLKNVLANEIVLQAMNDPLTTADMLMEWSSIAESASLPQVLFAMHKPWLPEESSVVVRESISSVSPQVPASCRSAVKELSEGVMTADVMIRNALANLTSAELRQLIESLPVNAVETSKVRFSFVRGEILSTDEMFELLKKVDLKAIRHASLYLASDVEKASKALQSSQHTFQGKVKVTVGNLPVIIGGVGDDIHSELDARITIDLGGNDTYTGRHGAGVGYSSVLIDLAGDDRYQAEDLSIGSAVLGVGIAYDLGGDDRYEMKSISLGAGLAGTGVFYDALGDDTVRSLSLSQGFSLEGAGLSVDGGGDDDYRIGLHGQGSSRTNGFGWLIDYSGHDTYRAGGVVLNSPLFEDVYYSFAQGFSQGYRLDNGGQPGGIGYLTDLGGRDAYLGETYCQGASYFYSVGALYDRSGNDVYTSHHYSQSSAMHLTAAYLFDLSGDDVYSTRYGASHTIGHDWGLAFMLDRAGNDTYSAYDTRPGLGVTWGTGVMIEGAGDDSYTGMPGMGQARSMTTGLGVFADLSGNDHYREPTEEEIAWVSGTGGTGLDYPTFQTTTSEGTTSSQEEVQVGSKPRPSDEELDNLWKKASQWRVGQAVAESDATLQELAEIGEPAMEYILENHLASMNRLGSVALGILVKKMGQKGISLLGGKALRANDAELLMILQTAVRGNIPDFGALIPNIIETKPELRRYAVSAAGALKANGAVDSLQPLLLDEDKALARSAMMSLAMIGDRSAIGSATSMLNSSDPLMREAAYNLLRQHPVDAQKLGNLLVLDAEEQKARWGLRLIAISGQPGTLQLVAQSLSDPRPGMRIEALNLLQDRCPEVSQERFEALKNDPHPLVAIFAKKLKP